MGTKNHPENRWFVSDAPVSDVSKDAFGHDDIADNLYRMVTEPTEHRRMIGLLGGFGVGKSTILELLGKKLHGHKGLSLIRISAERHEPVGFHRAAVYAFAEALVDQEQISEGKAAEILEPLRYSQSLAFADLSLSPFSQALQKLQYKINLSKRKFFMVMLLAIVIASLMIGFLSLTDFWNSASGFLISIITTSAFFTPFIWLANHLRIGSSNIASFFKPGTKTTQRAKVEAADEQEQAFADLVSNVKSRLVVAVDDIDRLSKNQILEALNAIRSFQLTCKKRERPIFIVSVDEEIIRSAIEKDHGSTKDEAQEFINRLFTLKQEVPVHETVDLRDYAQSLITQQSIVMSQHLGDELDDVTTMLIHDDVNDPRHVVRLVNAFSSDFRLALAREEREGFRAISAGLVSKNLDVLARVVVLKADFPTFFRAALSKTDLIDVASRASSLEFTDEEKELLKNSGFAIDKESHSKLYRYLARTAGWVPADIDWLPFLYLGQDRFSLTLGNEQARQIRTSLANNQTSDLVRLAQEAQKSGLERVDSFQQLVVNIVRQLDPAENHNGVRAILAASKVNDALHQPEISRAVANTLSARPDLIEDSLGALALLKCAPREPAQVLARTILSSSEETDEGEIWKARGLLRAQAGHSDFDRWMQQKIDSIETWENFIKWSQYEIDTDLGHRLLWRAIQLSANVQDDYTANESALDSVKSIIGQINELMQLADYATLQSAIGQPADTYECAIAHETLKILELSEKNLAELCGSIPNSVSGYEETVEPLNEVRNQSVKLAARVASEAPNWTIKVGDKKVHCVSLITDLVAEWIEGGAVPLLDGLEVLTIMAENKVGGQLKLARSLFKTWRNSTNDSPNENSETTTAVINLAKIVGQLNEATQSAIHDEWMQMLGTEGDPEKASIIASHLIASNNVHEWADDAIDSMIPWFSASHDFTGSPTLATATIMATGYISADAESSLVSTLANLMRAGGTNRQRAISTIAELPWTAEVLPKLTSEIAVYASEFPDNDFWKFIDMQILRSQIRSEFVARIDNSLEEEGVYNEALARAEKLVLHLQPDNALRLALDSASASVIRKVVKRSNEISEEERASTWSEYLFKASSEPEGTRAIIANVLAEENNKIYEQAVLEILAETEESGSERWIRVWRYITLPLSNEFRRRVLDDVEPLMVQSARDASAASIVLYATESDSEFDLLSAPIVKKSLGYWTRDQPNEDVAASISTAIRASTFSRKDALSSWKGKPTNFARRTAYFAAKDALGG